MKASLKNFFLLLLGVLFVFVANAVARVSDAEKQAAQEINENILRGHIKFLSDDLLEGRAPGTRGGQLGERYIASQFERMGLTPGAKLATDGTNNASWYQSFDILGVTSHVPKIMTLKSGAKTLELKFGDDFIATGEQKPSVAVKDAEVVFVGYGIVAPEQKWDDYKGVDVGDGGAEVG